MNTLNPVDAVGTAVHDEPIESLADVLDIVSRPDQYLREIVDTSDDPHYPAPLGNTHQGTPRPFPHGIWFRGETNSSRRLVPSVFRTGDSDSPTQFYDEREMFTDIRLRASQADLRGFNNLELMELMQHHRLPTRLMDWSESPLVACFFAAAKGHYKSTTYAEKRRRSPSDANMSVDHSATLYVLNAFRLNAITNLSGHSDANIFHPQDFDVVIRSVMAEHTYIDSVLDKMLQTNLVATDRTSRELVKRIYRMGKSGGASYYDINRDRDFLYRLAMPVAVMPKRAHPRMDAQLSCFTMHGGKMKYTDAFPDKKSSPRDGWQFMPTPVHLDDIIIPFRNTSAGADQSAYAAPDEVILSTFGPRPFLKKFTISQFGVSRIMIELDRLGITEAMIFPDMENQSNFARRRWATVGGDRPIWSLPRLLGGMLSKGLGGRDSATLGNHMSLLYGKSDT